LSRAGHAFPLKLVPNALPENLEGAGDRGGSSAVGVGAKRQVEGQREIVTEDISDQNCGSDCGGYHGRGQQEGAFGGQMIPGLEHPAAGGVRLAEAVNANLKGIRIRDGCNHSGGSIPGVG
jgi:hypothetical protein